jgi:hypothetical protein
MLEIKKAKGGYIVYLKAENGQILMTSEILKTEANAINNVVSSVLNAFRFSIILIAGKYAKEKAPNLWNGTIEKDLILTVIKHFNKLKKKKPTPKKAVKKKSATANKKAPVKKSAPKSEIIVNKKGKKVSVTKK